MKKIAIVLTMALMAVSCKFVSYTGEAKPGSGRIVCTGPVVTRTLPELTGFDAIKVNGQADVWFTQGEAYEVSVKANEEVFDYLDFTIEEGALVLQIKDKKNIKAETFDVYVTGPVLKDVRVNGASDFKMADYSATEDLNVVVNGAGDFELKRINTLSLGFVVNGAGDIDAEAIAVEKLTVEVNGAGDVEVSGTAGSAYFKVSGAGDINARELVCSDIQTKKSGVASIKLPR